MKWILKIVAAPIVASLALLVSVSGLLLSMSAYLFGFVSSILGLLGIIVLLTGAIKSGVIVLVAAMLVSPLGVPMLAAWMLGLLQGLRYAIQDHIYG